MLNVFFAGVALIAAGIVTLNLRVEGGDILLLAGAVVVGCATIAGLARLGKRR